MNPEGAAGPSGEAALPTDNPFAEPSPLPYQLPPFERIRDAHFRPAFLAGMAAQRAEIDAIAHQPATPTFDNTIVALERSGRLLERVSSVFFNLTQSGGGQALLQLEAEMAPRLTAHRDAIQLDAALFARVEQLHRERDRLGLDDQSRQLLERYHIDFVRAGARLPAAAQAVLRVLNERLAALRTQFRHNVLAANRDGAVVVEQRVQLDGLSDAQIQAAAQAAMLSGLPGRWLLALQNTTTQPLLEQLHDRQLRERLYRASVGRAAGAAADNRPVIAQLVRLRAERAQLLGFPSHAAYVLADENAGSTDAVNHMLQQVTGAALAAARRQCDLLQRLIDAECAATQRAAFTLQPWDWHYYAERQRCAEFRFGSAEIRPYFELDRVLHAGVFDCAQRLYGLTFQPRGDLRAWRDDVRVFEVFDADGSPLALLLADCYAREDKQGGAWMSNFVTQSKLLSQKAVVLISLNIAPPPAGGPTLLSFEEVTTLFHEFGHALHGMLSDVQYPLLSGTSVPRDFVEYPSQLNEMWVRDAQVLARCARHYRTSAPLPEPLPAQVIAAQRLHQGYLTTEYLAAALIDQAWHQLGVDEAPDADQIMAFEARVLARCGIDCPIIPPRYHSPYFLHIFADDYSAGYYAYLWSEILARDTGCWIQARGGLSRANGEQLRAKVLSRGWTVDTRQQFRELYGAEPDIGPLLDYRGLAAPPAR